MRLEFSDAHAIAGAEGGEYEKKERVKKYYTREREVARSVNETRA